MKVKQDQLQLADEMKRQHKLRGQGTRNDNIELARFMLREEMDKL